MMVLALIDGCFLETSTALILLSVHANLRLSNAPPSVLGQLSLLFEVHHIRTTYQLQPCISEKLKHNTTA